MELPIQAPYMIGAKRAVRFLIEPINYVKWATIAIEANDNKNVRAAFNAALLRHRTKIVDEDGKMHEITPEVLHAMPRPVAMPLVKFYDTEGDATEDETPEQLAERLAKQPKIIDDGDALTAPVLMKLGTPIAAAGKEISELEFIAKTYGDVETVLAAANDLEKAIECIKTLAKPPGMLALPSWAVDGISVKDGIFIQQVIVPRFLA